MNHQLNRPEVQNQLRWLIAHPSYLQELASSKPYIYHIVTEIRKRHLPGELALIPMIESSYDPFAYSGAGASGLWQLMPGTGTDLGLKQDWWYDGRRSIRPSTDAALNYLEYLNKYFHGDWVLAIAAYDSGEGTVSRSLKNSHQNKYPVNFWNLPLPSETKAYVPRLLALAEIIKYPERYKVQLPDIAHTPYFEEVNIGSQIDLNDAARLAGISYKDLIKLNPGFNRWATAPYKPYKLLIPTEKVASFSRNLAHMPEEKRMTWARHQVQKGENIYTVAKKYYTTAKMLRELNQLKSDKIRNGQSLLIPHVKPALAKSTQKILTSGNPPSYQTYKVVHIVQRGETFKHLEQKYQVSAAQIRTWNKMKSARELPKGKQLVIWRQKLMPGIYTVQKGDDVSGIARKYHTSVLTLKKLNPEKHMNTLKPGQQLIVG